MVITSLVEIYHEGETRYFIKRGGKIEVNRIEYYAKLDKYHLEHASTKGTTRDEHNYFMRIGEPGKYRYFYSKAEWDAYQESEARNKYEANKKKIENNSNLKLYNVTTEQRNTYNKNRDAANNAEADRWTKVKTDNIKKEATEKAQADASSNFKLSAEDLLKLKAQNLEDNKYMTKEQSEQNNKNLNDIKQKEQYEKNKAADEAKKKAEQDKYAEIRRQNEREALRQKAKRKIEEEETKRKGKENLNKALEKWQKEREEAKRAQQVEDAKKRIAERERAKQIVSKEEEFHRQKDREAKDAAEARHNIVNNFRDKSIEEIDKEGKKLHQELADVLAGKLTEFDENNLLYDRLEEKLKKIDPDYADYKKSLKEYLEPTDLKVTTKYYKDRFDKAEEALNQVAEDLKKEIADTKFKDIEQGKTYLQKEKDKYIEAKNKKAKVDLNKAKIDLRKVYDGDSDTFKLDPALMKVLNSKIWEIDNDYDGDLVDYIEPNLFGKFLKEDTAYNMVKDILDEMEQELSEDKVNRRYTEYINEIKKSL